MWTARASVAVSGSSDDLQIVEAGQGIGELHSIDRQGRRGTVISLAMAA